MAGGGAKLSAGAPRALFTSMMMIMAAARRACWIAVVLVTTTLLLTSWSAQHVHGRLPTATQNAIKGAGASLPLRLYKAALALYVARRAGKGCLRQRPQGCQTDTVPCSRPITFTHTHTATHCSPQTPPLSTSPLAPPVGCVPWMRAPLTGQLLTCS